MRVIGGRLGGRRLRSARGRGVRPTADRVREAIFNILGRTVVDAEVLDLFAGTGAMAIEALSRGATRATCVESSSRAIEALRANVASLALADAVTVVHGDALDYCRRIIEHGTTFDMVFCDPPYATPAAKIVDTVVDATWWTTVCVIEHGAATEVDPRSEIARDVRRYGDTGVTFFWRR